MLKKSCYYLQNIFSNPQKRFFISTKSNGRNVGVICQPSIFWLSSSIFIHPQGCVTVIDRCTFGKDVSQDYDPFKSYFSVLVGPKCVIICNATVHCKMHLTNNYQSMLREAS